MDYLIIDQRKEGMGVNEFGIIRIQYISMEKII